MTQLPQPDLSSRSYPSHISSITIVACSGHAAASGGSDDTIHRYLPEIKIFLRLIPLPIQSLNRPSPGKLT
ncbi:unnamed protein product [Eruca vesicaria subsp. sativa]|uniref:Uncharacterized protein n=1 Tax=Eruca vesicaria subsp. sativa TaxID=29727 RepID=A0ABC8KMI6_ERUVS|nr:unnamed protein product [Eruca vesicaria subsp. sativa]